MKNTRTSKSKGKGTYVKVRNGDTLGSIAQRNHTTVAKLQKLNNIKKYIYAGQRIRVN
jgi:membrane-bound lytic murein transglycosylase D